MIYQTYQPRSPPSQFVEFLWSREGDHLPQSQSRLLPTGSMELVIDLHQDRIPLFDRHSRIKCGSTKGMRICGAHSEGFIMNNAQKISAVGVHFKLGSHAAFFSLAAGELHNQIVSLEEVWHDCAQLRDCLREYTHSRKPLSSIGAISADGDAIADSYRQCRHRSNWIERPPFITNYFALKLG